MSEKEIAGKLQELIAELKKRRIISTQKEFAFEVKYDDSSLSQVLSRKRDLPDDVFKEIINRFSVNREWLLGFSEEMFAHNKNEHTFAEQSIIPEISDLLERVRLGFENDKREIREIFEALITEYKSRIEHDKQVISDYRNMLRKNKIID